MADIKIIVDSSDVVTADNRIDQLGKSGSVAEKGINKAARGMNQFGVVAKNGGKKLNTFNMQIQQGGYQLQDFVVQLQGGTSVFTAFGQQGSQFAGVFGPQGAVIGAVIAIGSAVGGMAYKMLIASEDVRTLEEKMEELESTSNDYADALSGLTMPIDAFGNVLDQVTGKVSALSAAMLEIKKIKFEESLEAVTKLLPAMESSPLGRKITGMEAKNIFDLFPEIKKQNSGGDAGRVAASFATAVGRTMEAKGLEAQSEAFENLRLKVIELAGPFKSMNDSQREFYQRTVDAQNQIKVVTEANAKANAKAIADAQKASEKEVADFLSKKRKLAESDEKRRFASVVAYNKKRASGEKAQDKLEQDKLDKIEKANEQLNAQNTIAIAKNALLRVEQEHGLQSIKYKEALVQFEDSSLRAKLRMKGYDEGLISIAVNQLATQRQITAELEKQSKVTFNMMEGSAAAQAMRKYAGRSVTSDKDPQFGDGTSIYEDPPVLGGGGKTDKEKLAEYLQGKQQELKLEESLVGIFGAERDIKSELFEVEQKYGKLIDTTQDSQLAGTLRQIEAEKERHAVIEEAKAQQEALANTIESSMETGFMAMIDGTMSVKEAFKSMAAAIIKDLIRILILQTAIKALKTAFGIPYADGGAFSGGSEIKAYADGGVVGGPTTFPMAGGKTGLMGEAGPEAIMPLKRGANGKLGVQMEGGGGDTINVVQNFSFQANGDDSVKKIIAQAAPQIAQMTKSSLLNDRRRGGATKAAFG